MAYFWVNQGLTYKEEVAGNCLWAPERTKDGGTLKHWDTMAQLEPGDVVFNYVKPAIRGYAVVRAKSVPCSRPYAAGAGYSAAQGGRIVLCDYAMLPPSKRLPKDAILEDTRLTEELATGENQVLAANKHDDFKGNYRFAQKYLCAISDTAGRLIGQKLGERGLPVPKVSSAKQPIPKTTVQQIIDARLGQGKFREDLLAEFAAHCAVTRLAIPQLLRASHIVRWSESTNEEKIDTQNGLLLAAGVDAAFDRWLVSFDEQGRMLTKLAPVDLAAIGASTPVAIPSKYLTPKRLTYLSLHRRRAGL